MSRSLCTMEAPYVGPMVNAHTHRCLIPITTPALGGNHHGNHLCHSCNHSWSTVGKVLQDIAAAFNPTPAPQPIVLCGVQVPTNHTIGNHPHHTCNIHVQNTAGTHVGLHHCNCGTGFLLPADPTAVRIGDANTEGARCVDCGRWRTWANLNDGRAHCRDQDACWEYMKHNTKGGTQGDGNKAEEGTPAQSLFSLSDVSARFDAIEADMVDRFGMVVAKVDALAKRQRDHGETLDLHAPAIRENGATIDALVLVQKAHDATLSRQADGIAGLYKVSQDHGARLLDRKNDYDAVLQRLHALNDRVERAEALAGGQPWRSDVAQWKAYTKQRFDALETYTRDAIRTDDERIGRMANVDSEMARRIVELEAAVANLVQPQVGMLAVDEHEHGGDWCPAQTGVITEEMRPSKAHMLHTCIVLDVHVQHKCSCGAVWVSQTSPIDAVSDSERPGGRLVTGVPTDAPDASALLIAAGRAASVEMARDLALAMHNDYVLRGYAHPYDSFTTRANLRTLVLLLGGQV